jgi:hypothetical protein
VGAGGAGDNALTSGRSRRPHSGYGTAVSTALDNALGLGLQLAKEAGDAHLSNINVRNAALAAIVGYVKQTVAAAVSDFNLTGESLAQKASARLAVALHVPAAAATAATPAIPTPASPIPAGS